MFRSHQLVAGDHPGFWEHVFIHVAFSLQDVAEIVSGVILIKSMYTIRKFFKDRNEKEAMNTAALWTHTACFVLYTVVCSVYAITYAIYTADPVEQVFIVFTWAATCYWLGSLLSQVILAEILWKFIKDAQSAETPEEGEYDKHTDLKARIWNSLMKVKVGDGPDYRI